MWGCLLTSHWVKINKGAADSLTFACLYMVKSLWLRMQMVNSKHTAHSACMRSLDTKFLCVGQFILSVLAMNIKNEKSMESGTD